MEPNICEICGARDVTLILASWYDDKLRCRDCYNTLWEQEQHRLRQDTKQNVETIQAVHSLARQEAREAMITKFDERIKQWLQKDAFDTVEMYYGLHTPKSEACALAIQACTRQLTEVYGVVSTEETEQEIELAVGRAIAVSYGGTVEVY